MDIKTYSEGILNSIKARVKKAHPNAVPPSKQKDFARNKLRQVGQDINKITSGQDTKSVAADIGLDMVPFLGGVRAARRAASGYHKTTAGAVTDVATSALPAFAAIKALKGGTKLVRGTTRAALKKGAKNFARNSAREVGADVAGMATVGAATGTMNAINSYKK